VIGDGFEDFVMPTHSRITALNYFDDIGGQGPTITFSQYPDFYEYRIISKKGDDWTFDKFGPFIDKTIDQVFVCTGIHYIDLSRSESILSANQLPSFGDYLISVSIRG
jgi:hypothetical protein